MWLSEAGMRYRQTKLTHPDHRLFPRVPLMLPVDRTNRLIAIIPRYPVEFRPPRLYIRVWP
jgi:hypothetical protein